MSATTEPQTSIYETTLDNPQLEEALEQRQTAKEERATANKAFKEADDLVKVRLQDADIADAPVRVGRFLIEQKASEAKEVAFTRGGGTRLQISLLPDE